MARNALFRLLPLLSFSTIISGIVTPRATCSNGKTVSSAECCVWFDVLEDIQAHMYNGGICDEVASDAIRLTFHDAIGYSSSLFEQGLFGGGGADGSMMYFAALELNYPRNAGIQTIATVERPFAELYNVTFGDMIQFSGAVALRNCPGGPRLRFLAGRPPAIAAAPNNGLLPGPEETVDVLLSRMADAGLSPSDLIDLLASHSVAFQEKVDPSIPFTPFDSTPTILDAQFFVETLLNGTDWPGDGEHIGEAKSPLDGEFRLLADHRLARDPRTACHWQSLISHPESIAPKFKRAMEKLAVIGQDANSLVDCSEVIPEPEAFEVPLPHLPAGKSLEDIEASCPDVEFPHITADPGPSTAVPSPTHIENDRLPVQSK
ncbi:manganese peroxidase isozyme precursor [Armillaria gallica]|uniref:Peroxidase n=1 Tax=Armillaria gallica TaxID=47427 RepID=A0A2H3DYB8_ARMGA|nr:manganese peroxidase isozyme precursor [Armillaria gallica]